MKKTLSFLLMLSMLFSVLLISVNATIIANDGNDYAETAIQTANVAQENAECTCGGSYGAWEYPAGVACQGGRYERTCNTCSSVQTAKDIYPTTISYTVPAIGANVGDVVMLSVYDVYFTSSAVKTADKITWSSNDITITDNCIYPTVAGTYKLTATDGSSTKNVYLVVKNPTDTEYVLFLDDFNRTELGSDYTALEVPNNTKYYIEDGKLILDATGNTNNQMRILLPEWIGDFGDYKIDTNFTILKTMNNNTSYWFAVMARVGKNGYPLWQAAIRQGAKDYVSSGKKTGVEIASKTSSGAAWSVPHKGSYTENISPDKYYTQTFDLSGKNAVHSINGTPVLTSSSISYLSNQMTGRVGFHLRASVVSIESVKITVPIDDSIHKFDVWEVTKAATCTADGTEKSQCENCDAIETRTIKATGHMSFGEWEITKAATCTVDGSKQRACADCGFVETSTIKAGHDLVKHTVQAPSCTQSGYREYNTCTKCDYTTFAGEIGPFEHYYDREIKCIAHRGYSNTAPENTLPAYILARELGFLYAECDVSFTKDGVAVLLHDTTIDRTSNGSGAIADLTYEELLQYDFGSWKNASYAGTKIPTFEEFIALCKEIGMHPYIEIKNDGATYTQEQVQGLVDIVEKYDMQDNCTWISFNLTYLEYVKNVDTTARLGYVSSKTITQSMINSVKALETGENEVFLDISYNMINENNAMLAAANGIALETWTVDNVNDIKNRSKYISGYTSNKLVATDTLVKTSVTAPTCGNEGYTTYTCFCGATKVDNYVPATNEHVIENGICTKCDTVIYCANPEHNLEIISISYENGFDKSGIKIVKCLDCGANETETEAPALFNAKGYSASENGTNELSVGIYVDIEAIMEYQNALGVTVNYGAFAVAQAKLGSNEVFDENGKMIQGAICADVTDYSFSIFHVKVAGIIDEYKDDKLAMGAYVAVIGKEKTEYSYIQNSAPSANEKYAFISYNDIVNPKKEEENVQ